MENPPSLGPLNRVAIASSQITGLVRLHQGIELAKIWSDFGWIQPHHEIHDLRCHKHSGQEASGGKRWRPASLEINGVQGKIFPMGELWCEAKGEAQNLIGQSHLIANIEIFVKAHSG